MSEIMQRMFDLDVRVEQMFWIPGQVAQPTHEFRDFLSDDLPDATEVHAKLPWLKECAETYADDKGETVIGEFSFKRLDGFIIQLATPVPIQFFDERSYTSTWGYIQTKWFYVATLDEVPDLAKAWREVVHARAREKLAKPKKRAKSKAGTPQ